MKTKNIKTLILLITVYFMSKPLTAQYAYFHLGGGYGLPSSPVNFDGLSNSTDDGTTVTNEQIKLSLGKGINLNGAFGYMFNDYFGAELGVNYLMSSAWESKSTTTDGPNNSAITVNTIDASMTRINPMFILQSESSAITPYAKLGMMIGFGTIKNTINLTDDNFGNAIKLEGEYEMSGGIGIGFNAALGANFEIGDNMFLFGELAFVNMSYSPTKGEITKYNANGNDLLSDMDVSDKKVEFVDSYELNGPQPSTEPSKELKNKNPFGSVGLNIGFKMTFN
jgi:hypothetical protein